jgi:hypothetical protein
MKFRVLRLLAIFVSLVCIGFLGYRGYGWWQKYQKRKALFLYFQKNSPVTKRIPKDALLYINLYDLRRVYDQLRETDLSQVLAHWLDTGMSENEKPNPLLGGMLEKTILNIVGDEFAIALLPAKERPFDFVAIARIAPGSDFLLNLALSSAKNIEKIDSGDKILYRSKTKDPNFPAILIHVQENLAYASNNFQRLKESYSSEGTGPDFLARSSVEPIPENTVLFAQLQKPHARALLHGEGKFYRLQISDLPAVSTHVPEIRKSDSDVLRIQTNSPGFIGHPSAAYVLQSVMEEPASAVLLSFSKPEKAASFEQRVVASFNPVIPESFSKDGIQCLRHTSSRDEEFICRKGVSLLMARGQFSLDQASFLEKHPGGQSPFVFRIQFRKDTIREYHSRVQNKDWSDFSGNEPFYFLSCIKQITGGIDQTNKEIAIELE